MGIPVGRLSLYSACAGVHPKLCLPVMLDVGTNNEVLLNDTYYVGLRRHRVSGAITMSSSTNSSMRHDRSSRAWYSVPVDFANHSAFRLLRKYRDSACVFNDDIQGTAAVALAGILSALRITGGKLADQKLLFLGAGEAATGIADLVVSAMVAQGLSSRRRDGATGLSIAVGLVVKDRGELASRKRPTRTCTLRSAISHRHPNARAHCDNRGCGSRRHVHGRSAANHGAAQ